MLFSSPLIFAALCGCQPGIRGCYLAARGFLQVSVDFYICPLMLSRYPWMLGLGLDYLTSS